MRIALIILACYLAVAAYAWWFAISTSKVGMRPSRRQIIETARREGLSLMVLAILWFPIIAYVLVMGPDDGYPKPKRSRSEKTKP